MRQLISSYALVVVIAVAAGILGYRGYRQIQAAKNAQRIIALETMRELAEEKVLNIEYSIVSSDRSIYSSVDVDNLLALREQLRSERAPLISVIVLDESLGVVPNGYFSKRRNAELFLNQTFPVLLPELGITASSSEQPNYKHMLVGGVDFLFSFAKKSDGEKTYFIILEHDINYLVGNVFPKYFDIRSRHLYQIVNQQNAVVYGPKLSLEEWPQDVAEVAFPQTLVRWRVRVAHKSNQPFDSGAFEFEILLVAGTLLVIVVGLYALLTLLRRERRTSELKSEFISNVSHELKTPLSIIKMFGELLSGGRVKDDEQVREYGDVIGRESERLTQLIDNVLDFEKLERGVDTYSLQSMSPSPLLLAVVEIANPQLARVGMEVELEDCDNLPKVDLDESSMTLALLNIIDNAAKYAAVGKRLEISGHSDNKYVWLRFKDFGPGIAADDREKVFQRFYRGKQKSGIRGSGIGLSLVSRVIAAHNGQVSLENRRDGTTIVVKLPRTPSTDQ